MVYCFHTLISEFGPYVYFAENSERYVICLSFVGFNEHLLLCHTQT